MATLVQSGLDLTPLITHRYPIDDYLDGFETMLSGQSGKVILGVLAFFQMNSLLRLLGMTEMGKLLD